MSLRFFMMIFMAAILIAPVSFAQEKAAEKTSEKAGKPWEVRCEKDPATKKDEGPKRGRCEIFQRLTLKKTGERVMEAAIGFPKDKNTARGIFIAPLGILLQAGLQMKIDDGKPYKFQLRYCEKGGCFGFVDLGDSILKEMRRGKKLTVSFQASSKKNVNVEMTLDGFSGALDQIN
jgi:invasion protein IalB